jgi:hypothetical protein
MIELGLAGEVAAFHQPVWLASPKVVRSAKHPYDCDGRLSKVVIWIRRL